MMTMDNMKIGKDEFTLVIWSKVAGKERIYISSASKGKEMGYIDVNAGCYKHTGKAFATRSWQEEFYAGVAAYIETLDRSTLVAVAPAAVAPAEKKTCWECGCKFTYAQCRSNDGDWNQNGGYCGC